MPVTAALRRAIADLAGLIVGTRADKHLVQPSLECTIRRAIADWDLYYGSEDEQMMQARLRDDAILRASPIAKRGKRTA